jgi:inosose dehydratase
MSHRLSRRGFLSAIGAVPAAVAAARPVYRPRFAGQTYVWSQYFSRRKEDLAAHREEVLAAFAHGGYSEMELFTPFVAPDVTASTAELLRKYRLTAPIVYAGGVMHTAGGARATVDEVLQLADRIRRPLGLKAINFNPNPKPRKERKSDAELEIQSKAIDRLGAELSRRALRLFLHQHDPEMAENAREWRHTLRNTNPKHVELCLDVHWVYCGGQDVMTLLAEAAPRLASLHLRNSRNGVWLEELTDGDVDYHRVAAYLKRVGFRGWLIPELAWDPNTEITRPLEENLKRSLEYARRVFA